MKKRTILFVFIAFVLGGALGAGGLVVAEHYMSSGSIDALIEYIKADVVPSAVNVIGIIIAFYIGVKPAAGSVITASNGFLKSSAIVSEVKSVGDKTSADVAVLIEENRKAISEYKKAAEAAQAEVAAMRSEFSSIKHALKVGFGNNGELVRGGYARRICKILEDDNGEKEI